MKHVKTLSAQKPAQADQWSWAPLNAYLPAFLPGKIGRDFTGAELVWLQSQIDNKLTD